MNLRTLLTWSMAAALLAGCSGGGGGSVTPSNANNTAPTTGGNGASSGTTTLSVKVDGAQLGALMAQRSAKFVAPVANLALNYAIFTQVYAGGFPYAEGNLNASGAVQNGGVASYSGSLNLSTAPNCSAAIVGADTYDTYTCTITVQSATAYDLQMNLAETGTIIAYAGPNPGASDAYVPFGPLLPGQSQAEAIQMVPILSTLSFSAPNGSEFYEDGTATVQTIDLTTNVLDTENNTITGYYGPAADYPKLTLSVTSGGGSENGVAAPTTVVALPFGTQENPGAPAAQGGYNAENLTYTPSNGTDTVSLALSLASTGGPATVPLSIPYLYFTAGTGSAATTLSTVIPGVNNSTNVSIGTDISYFPIGASVILSDGANGFVGVVNANTGASPIGVTETAAILAGAGPVASTTVLYNTQLVYLPDTVTPQTAIVTENATAGGTADTSYTVTTAPTFSAAGAPCGGDATIKFGGVSPGNTTLVGPGGTANNTTVPNAAPLMLYVTANNTGPANGVCTVTVASNLHAAMTSSITLLFPAAVQGQITSHARQP